MHIIEFEKWAQNFISDEALMDSLLDTLYLQQPTRFAIQPNEIYLTNLGIRLEPRHGMFLVYTLSENKGRIMDIRKQTIWRIVHRYPTHHLRFYSMVQLIKISQKNFQSFINWDSNPLEGKH